MPKFHSKYKKGNKVRLIKLYPHARKKGKEIGQIWEIFGFGCKDDPTLIWLRDEKDSWWTVDQDFLDKHFEEI